MLKLIFLALCLVGDLYCPIRQTTGNSKIIVATNGSLTSPNTLSLGGDVSLESGASLSGSVVTFTKGKLSDAGGSGTTIAGTFSVNVANGSLDRDSLANFGITFTNAIIDLGDVFELNNDWLIQGDCTIRGAGGNILSLAASAARITIANNATLTIDSISLQGVTDLKFLFAGVNSSLYITNSTFQLADHCTYIRGSISVGDNSVFVMDNKSLVQSGTATFQVVGTSLWLDSRVYTATPIFGYMNNASVFTSYIDNATVRHQTDQSRVIDPATLALLEGFAAPEVTIVSSTNLNSNDQMVFDQDTNIEGNGTSLTFTSSPEPQILVQPGFVATFGDIEMLRINQNTFGLSNDSVVRFQNNVVLEFVEDVVFDRGLFEVLGFNSQVIMRGLGGLRKISFVSNSEGGHGGLNLGSNSLIFEDMELVGLHNIIHDKKIVNGEVYEGRIVLSGESRVNIGFDTDINFLVRGRSSKLVLQQNNLTYNGKIRFQDGADTNVRIGFTTQADSAELRFSLGKDALLMSAVDAECGVTFESDKLTLINLWPSSFVVAGRSVLSGEIINIKQNPILQKAQLFSLGSSLELLSDDLPNPVEIVPLATDNQFLGGPSIFRGLSTRLINVPSPRMVVKSLLYGNSLKGTISVRSSGRVSSFKPHPLQSLNLILEGNSTVQTQARRFGKVAQIVRTSVFEEELTEEEVDTFKPEDKIYVTGTNNKIVVTGFLYIQGELIMDEGAELIFEFDESTDAEKAVIFVGANSAYQASLPRGASIVFQGAGVVAFEPDAKLNFLGDAPESAGQVSETYFKDNRPSIMLKNYAQLEIAHSGILTFQGRGKLQLLENAELRLLAGSLVMGVSSDDFFDLVVDKQGAVRVGVVAEDDFTYADLPARLSMPYGVFNLRFSRAGELSVRNGGILEISQRNSALTEGVINNFRFDKDSKLELLYNGALTFGMFDVDQTTIDATSFYWDNSSGVVNGDGVVALFTASSSSPFLAAQLQPRSFVSDGLVSPLTVVKGLARVTPALVFGADFIDKTDGLTKVITSANRVVTLESGDVIRREAADEGTSGNIYGTTVTGTRFLITPAGERRLIV